MNNISLYSLFVVLFYYLNLISHTHAVSFRGSDEGNTVIGPSSAFVSSSSGRQSCVPLGECIKCSEEDSSWTDPTCRTTGYKQKHKCIIAQNKTDDEENSDSEEEMEVKVFLSCKIRGSDSDQVLWFETCMLIGSAGSLYVVWQRKRQAYQRLTNIVNN